jgi:hypothetical protein
MFRRGDVEAARSTARLAIPAAQVEELTAENISMADAWKKAGMPTSDLLARRVELRFTSGGKLEADLSREASSPVSWDTKAGLYTVDAPAAKAVVGRCTGKTTVLAGAEFEVQANSRNFAVLTLNAVDGQPLDRSSRLLLVAAGNVENTGMGWNTDHTSVGTQWGRAPTICEGIAAKVTVTMAAKAARVHALDGNGARAGEVPAKLVAGKLSFEIGPRFKTLWYEIVVE